MVDIEFQKTIIDSRRSMSLGEISKYCGKIKSTIQRRIESCKTPKLKDCPKEKITKFEKQSIGTLICKYKCWLQSILLVYPALLKTSGFSPYFSRTFILMH